MNILKASSSAGIYTSEATFQSDCNTPPWHSVRVRWWLPYRLYSGCLVLSLLIHNWKTREPTSWKPARLSAERDWFQSSVSTYGNIPPQPGNNIQPGSIPVQVCGCVFSSVQTWEKNMTECSLKAGPCRRVASAWVNNDLCRILYPETQRRCECVLRFTFVILPMGPEVLQMWVEPLVKAALGCREQRKQPRLTDFSISQLKVTNWQEGHGPRGHLIRRDGASAKACKSSCPRANIAFSVLAWSQAPWKVGCEEAGRHPLGCLRCSRIHHLYSSCFTFKASSLLSSAGDKQSDFLNLHTAVRATARPNTHRWGIFPSLMLDNWRWKASALWF